MFQFTHPGGVRPTLTVLSERRELFQFTHPGGVRLSAVSTSHSPTYVSIHAPGRGATSYSLPQTWQVLCFNSRTREGCDRQVA